MHIRFKHLVEDRDRHGNIRIYVRMSGRQKVRIRATFGTEEFVAAYNAAVSDHVTAPPQAREAKAGSPFGTTEIPAARKPDKSPGRWVGRYQPWPGSSLVRHGEIRKARQL